MKWQKLLTVMLVVMMAAMVGCGKAEESVSATNSTTPQSTPTPQDTTPAPPEGVSPGNRPGPVIDWASAAAKLGVTEQQLREALGDPLQVPLDLAASAKELGISEESLGQALGLPEGGPPTGGPPGQQGPAGQRQ